jgi:transposase InsO family protein
VLQKERPTLLHGNSGELRLADYELFGIRGVATSPGAPDMNAYAERFVGSIRREILDRMVIFTERQLRRVVSAYVRWYNGSRPHQEIGNRTPDRAPPHGEGPIPPRPVLFGLYRELYREAA